MSVPASWQQFTIDNLERARKQRELSIKLRGEMDTLMKSCATDMWNQFNCVNNALNARVQQTKDTGSKLQCFLQKTSGEIKEMERTVACLRKAIREKEDPLKVAETRLEERTRRVDVELCKDPAMIGLQKEIDDLREGIRVLEAKLREAEEALMRLRKARATLEHDIQTKDRSLDIDAKVCIGLRKKMATDPGAGPMMTVPLNIC